MYSVKENTGGDRTGLITINGSTMSMTFTVIQKVPIDCGFSISSASKEFDCAGGAGTVYVTADSDCKWTAASNNSTSRPTAYATVSIEIENGMCPNTVRHDI